MEVRVAAGGSAPDGKREVIFTVTDTGIGIPDDKKELLFRVFQPGGRIPHPQFTAAPALGLPSARRSWNCMGGTITFESEEGKGSTFSFTIPLAEAGPRERRHVRVPNSDRLKTTTPAPEEKEPRLLLAEDDPTISKFSA